eukprot:6214126-Pleurochrysis_carterae.AAC.3
MNTHHLGAISHLLVCLVSCVEAKQIGASLAPSISNFRAPSQCKGIFRSSSPAGISGADVQSLVSLNLRTVLDLRSPHESERDEGPQRLLAHFPRTRSPRPGSRCTVNVNLLDEWLVRVCVMRQLLRSPQALLDLVALRAGRQLLPVRPLRQRAAVRFDAAVATLLNRVTLVDVYWWVLRMRAPAIRRALRLCAREGTLPLLVHCTHGKDRTGLFVAILQHICGVPLGEIAAEYARSDGYGRSEEGQRLMLKALPPRLARRLDISGWCGRLATAGSTRGRWYGDACTCCWV